MARKKYKLTPEDMHNKVYEELPFEGEFAEMIGVPERCGTWIIWGASANGKTSFAMRLAKYICEIGEKVAYVSLEMGDSKSTQMAMDRECMRLVGNKFQLWVDMDVATLKKELKKQRSPQIVFIDSLQYLGINYAGYRRLIADFPKKLFVFISHANEAGAPKGACATQIMYDAMVKIQVQQFMAKANSRYGGGKIYTIWEEGAQRNPEGAKILNNDEEMEVENEQ